MKCSRSRLFVLTACATLITWIYYTNTGEDPLQGELARLEPSTNRLERSHILHQIWKNSSIPLRWRDAVLACKGHSNIADGFKYILWTHDKLKEFIEENYPWFVDIYVNYPYLIQRVDAAKYLLIYHYGGMYLDLDIYCRRKLLEIFAEHNSTRYDVILAKADPYGVATDMLIAPPRHPFFLSVIQNLPRASGRWFPLPYVTVMASTGPLFLTETLQRYPHPEHIHILNDTLYTRVYFRHLPGGSWHEWDGKLIYSIFGIYRRNQMTIALLVALVVALGVTFRRRRRNVGFVGLRSLIG